MAREIDIACNQRIATKPSPTTNQSDSRVDLCERVKSFATKVRDVCRKSIGGSFNRDELSLRHSFGDRDFGQWHDLCRTAWIEQQVIATWFVLGVVILDEIGA